MHTNKHTAKIVGILLIIGTISGILSLIFSAPIRDAQDVLVYISTNENQVRIAALLVLIMGFSLAMIPILMFPVLKKQDEALALGYIVFRGAIETVTSIAIAISWLLLLPLSQVYAQVEAREASSLSALGDRLLASDEIAFIATIVFCLGAVMFYSLLYQSKIIPRFISGWGIIAVVPYLGSALLVAFSIITPMSTMQVIMQVPLALQEMVLAIWLIVKGFNASAIATISIKRL